MSRKGDEKGENIAGHQEITERGHGQIHYNDMPGLRSNGRLSAISLTFLFIYLYCISANSAEHKI